MGPLFHPRRHPSCRHQKRRRLHYSCRWQIVRLHRLRLKWHALVWRHRHWSNASCCWNLRAPKTHHFCTSKTPPTNPDDLDNLDHRIEHRYHVNLPRHLWSKGYQPLHPLRWFRPSTLYIWMTMHGPLCFWQRHRHCFLFEWIHQKNHPRQSNAIHASQHRPTDRSLNTYVPDAHRPIGC